MSSIFNKLLISSPNDGGVFLAHDGSVRALDYLSTTGLSISGQRFARAIQPALLALHDRGMVEIIGTDFEFDDVHDALLEDDNCYLVDTAGNGIILFNMGGSEVTRWTFPGEPDSWHINCVARIHGSMCFTAFGDFRRHREYKGETAGRGFVQSLATGQRLAEGLSQPHSLKEYEDGFLVANSECCELLMYPREGGEPIRKINLGGYVRGVAFNEKHIFAGLSRSRNVPPGIATSAAKIVAVSRATWTVEEELELPFNEVYDIQQIPDVELLIKMMSSISSHASRLYAGIVSRQQVEIHDLTLSLGRDETASKRLNQATEAISTIPADVERALKDGTKAHTVHLGEVRETIIEALAINAQTMEKYVSSVEQERALSIELNSVRQELASVQKELVLVTSAAKAVAGTDTTAIEALTALQMQMANLKNMRDQAVLESEGLRSEVAKAEDRATLRTRAEVFELREELSRARSELEAAQLSHGKALAQMRDEFAATSQRDADALKAAQGSLEESQRLRWLESAELGERMAELKTTLVEFNDRHQQEVNQLQMEKESEARRAEELQHSVNYLLDTARSDLLLAHDRHLEEASKLQGQLNETMAMLSAVHQSKSFKLTSPFRVGRRLFSPGSNVLAGLWQGVSNAERWRNGYSVLRRQGLVSFGRRTAAFLQRGGPGIPPPAVESVPSPPAIKFDLRAGTHVVILTSPHCLFLAELIEQCLREIGIASKIIFERPASGFDDVPHFVISPQIHPVLPGFYVAYQLEQSVSSRWFTPDYFDRLRNSFAIFDYSLQNIEYLTNNDVSPKQIYYLPVDALKDAASQEEEDIDVLFYGDPTSPRRREFIEKLSADHNVVVASEVFGDDLRSLLRRAKVVVNIHYYEGALLETTRIWECLSLSKIVVSESSADVEHHAGVSGLVDFVDVGDAQAMSNRVAYWLANSLSRNERKAEIAERTQGPFNWFKFYFYRFLLSSENVSFDEFWSNIGKDLPMKSERQCLNLPEYVARRKDFEKDNQYGFALFPGLRHSKGWVGCALSYKYISLLAERNGLNQLTVCEDDVEFPQDFSGKFGKILDDLNSSKFRWDIFSGLLANLHPDARVHAVKKVAGTRYILIDRLISTVLNVYSKNMFGVIGAWDETNQDVHNNTIDRYLEKYEGLTIATTLPFLVGHKEEQFSTIWNFQNTQYSELIAESTRLLAKKVKDSRFRRVLPR